MKETLLYEASIDEKPILKNLLELYVYDFSEFNQMDVNAEGTFGYPSLDAYWIQEGYYPFLIKTNGHLSGFALVKEVFEDGAKVFVVAEFFVMRKYRTKGIGQFVAHQLFDRFRGLWHVSVRNYNKPALIFWDKTIKAYALDHYKILQKPLWEGPVYAFESRTYCVE